MAVRRMLPSSRALLSAPSSSAIVVHPRTRLRKTSAWEFNLGSSSSTISPQKQELTRNRPHLAPYPRSLIHRVSPPSRWYSAQPERASQDSLPAAPPWDILFCGTDAFALQILQQLHKCTDLYKSLAVITPRDAPAHRGRSVSRSAVKQWAIEKGIPHRDAVKGESLLFGSTSNDDSIKAGPNPLLITASYGDLIDDKSLKVFRSVSPSQALNVHPSLLPKLRGAAPIPWAIAKRCEETGVTIQQLSVGKFDCGRILAQRSVPVPSGATYETLMPVLAHLSSDLLIDTLHNLQERHRTSREQDPDQATYAPKLQKSHFLVDWHRDSARDIEAKWRAFSHTATLRSYLWPTTFPQAGHTLLPVCEVMLADIRLVTRGQEWYKATASRIADCVTPRPGRAWFNHVRNHNGAIIIESLTDEERDQLRRAISSSQNETAEGTEDDAQGPREGLTRLLKKMPRTRLDIVAPDRSYLPAISVHNIRLAAANFLTPAAWWKNQNTRRSSKGYLSFGPPQSETGESERVLWNKQAKQIAKAKDKDEKAMRIAAADRLARHIDLEKVILPTHTEREERRDSAPVSRRKKPFKGRGGAGRR